MHTITKGLCALAVVLTLASPAMSQDFTVTSPQFIAGQTMSNAQVYNSFGCSGDNISPELTWTNPPTGTKSFAITMYDPDAPTGSGWWHWVLFNIPASAKSIPLNAGANAALLPQGTIASRTDFGVPGYGGACPPTGDKAHRYIVTVHALNVDSLPLDHDAMPALVGFYLSGSTIGTAVLEVLYNR